MSEVFMLAETLPPGGAGPENALPPGGDASLQAVLGAWHTATVRLEHTHKALRAEVRRLTDELEIKNRELARKNRLTDLGQMASHVAHEVRNNLVPVTLYMSLLRRRLTDDPGNLDVLNKVAAGLTTLDATVNDLLYFTSDRDPQRQSFSLRKLVEDVLGSLAPQFAAQAIQTRVDVPENQLVTADQHMVRRAILNLALNALDAMPEEGTLAARSTDGPRGVELEIADSGPGLSEDVLRRVFEPFFSTKHGGTGLGLAIVSRIAEVHGGEIKAANRSGGGAVFTLRVPHPDAREAAR